MYEKFDITRMNEYAEGLNNHIYRTEEFVNSMKSVKHAIDEIRMSNNDYIIYELKRNREDFQMLLKHLERSGLPSIDVYACKIDQLKELIGSSAWPIAIDPDYIAETDDAKKVTAKNILDLLINEHLVDLKFLDFKCGGGFVAAEASQRGVSISVGYDSVSEWRCPSNNHLLLTQNIKEVEKEGPYDIILLYDVLDHCDDPVSTLIQVKNLLSERGRIYVRNHPWCSKHGGHLYEHINKAYIHVIFDEVEQMRLFGKCAKKLIN